MEYKRLEIYVGWTCNQKCTYCMEFPTMEESWNVRVSKLEILKKLIKFKKLGYNHVTYLGGEPFIQGVFFDALKLAKKLGYVVLVTTNCTTLHLEAQASKFLPYIDELILSLEGITVEQQQKISRTKNYVDWEKVFENINRYWKGKMLKANIVITPDNLNYLFDLVKFSLKNNIKNISVTYPDIDEEYYSLEHIKNHIAPSYKECIPVILEIIAFCKKNSLNLKLPDFPFCVFPEEKIEDYLKLTDDFDYQSRLKVNNDNSLADRENFINYENSPRERKQVELCKKCYYNNSCWGPAFYYNELYGLSEIKPIIK